MVSRRTPNPVSYRLGVEQQATPAASFGPGSNLEMLLGEYELARAYSLSLIAGLSEPDIAWRPNEHSSAIGWHLGHQAAVNHFMVRNLTAAEPSFNAEFDRLFDSATPEPDRGKLPGLTAILQYRDLIAESTLGVIARIQGGDVGAPVQLGEIAAGLLRGVINHEYQHDTWIAEVRETLGHARVADPASTVLTNVEGYWLLA